MLVFLHMPLHVIDVIQVLCYWQGPWTKRLLRENVEIGGELSRGFWRYSPFWNNNK
jgi:hypothetical protein